MMKTIHQCKINRIPVTDENASPKPSTIRKRHQNQQKGFHQYSASGILIELKQSASNSRAEQDKSYFSSASGYSIKITL